ncbi:MAG: hypothetical protein ACI95K_001955, partial [Lentimonas sp.]
AGSISAVIGLAFILVFVGTRVVKSKVDVISA